ncbi:MAG: hypothetical protein ABR923_20550 [Terracidiphilus sp.]|jgi:hypothetical protein
MISSAENARTLRTIRIWLVVFMVGLVLSGITAFPLQHELAWLAGAVGGDRIQAAAPSLVQWIQRVHEALNETGRQYPFLAYGTDWLAFAHLALAVAFIGPLRDPVRNKWVLTFGLIACAGVVPLALIAGQVRGIPIYWRLIDCSFGVFGAIPLVVCLRAVRRLEESAPREC